MRISSNVAQVIFLIFNEYRKRNKIINLMVNIINKHISKAQKETATCKWRGEIKKT